MSTPQPARGTSARQWLALGAAAAAVLALLLGLVIGRSTAGDAAVSDPVDLGFVRDMGVHHAQAVEMSAAVHVRTADPKLRYLAFDIMTTQQGQIGLMTGWLRLWGQSHRDSAVRPMAWMGDAHDGPMPGMATRAQVAALRTLPVPAMEEQFLRLMIRHHRGAVPMADFAAAQATSRHVRDLARNMSAGQESEIALMQDYLALRGLPAEPDAGGHGGPSPAASPPSPGHTGHG